MYISESDLVAQGYGSQSLYLRVRSSSWGMDFSFYSISAPNISKPAWWVWWRGSKSVSIFTHYLHLSSQGQLGEYDGYGSRNSINFYSIFTLLFQGELGEYNGVEAKPAQKMDPPSTKPSDARAPASRPPAVADGDVKLKVLFCLSFPFFCV